MLSKNSFQSQVLLQGLETPGKRDLRKTGISDRKGPIAGDEIQVFDL